MKVKMLNDDKSGRWYKGDIARVLRPGGPTSNYTCYDIAFDNTGDTSKKNYERLFQVRRKGVGVL